MVLTSNNWCWASTTNDDYDSKRNRRGSLVLQFAIDCCHVFNTLCVIRKTEASCAVCIMRKRLELRHCDNRQRATVLEERAFYGVKAFIARFIPRGSTHRPS